MTDILINWLNKDVKVSKNITPSTFAEDFSNGYLLGEILHKYQLQNDFDQFSQNKTSDSKLNNFTRVEPILNLLGIPFDTNVARLIMTEKHGEATKILYQLFIALNKKQKAGLTGTAIETMKPAAPAKLDYMKSLIYKERLKHLTPRQADLNLGALQEEFNQKAVKLEQTAFRMKLEEEERIQKDVQKRRMDLMEKRKQVQAQMAERLARIHAAKLEIPKTPTKTIEALQQRKFENHQREIDRTVEEIAKFEAKLAAILPPSKPFNSEDMSSILKQEEAKINELEYLKPKSNDVYINKIRKRLNEDESARNEREKRRRKVLVEQMKAHEAQEENRREEMLVNRLMRQSQQERRIAVQLLQARHEKEIIKNNRLFREKQYEERRLKEFEEALNRESEMARLAKLDYIEETKRNEELHAQIATQRAEARYTRHYDMCGEILSEIVDMACKVAEYRELTEGMVPQKIWREWRSLFVSGQPLYDREKSDAIAIDSGPTPADVLEMERQSILAEGDFQEYKDMIGEWAPPEGSEIPGPPNPNPIVGHVINRLFNMVHPPTPPPALPEFPPFPIKACILGKTFSGKSTAAHKLAETHRLTVLNADEIVKSAVEAYQNNEMLDGNEQMTTDNETTIGTDEPLDDEIINPEVEGEAGSTPTHVKVRDSKGKSGKLETVGLTTRAKLGLKVSKLLKRGKPVDDQLTVDILAEAIRQIPDGNGWVLDGYPNTYAQAKLLEKALSGFDAGSKDPKKGTLAKNKNSRLAPDPKPAPAAPEPVSAINVVILFDMQDSAILKRAAGRYEAMMAQKKYHQEFNPPPEGSITGVQNQEQIMKASDPAHDEQQVQARITGFLDNWPKLEKWFAKFGILKKIDGSLEETSLYLEAETILEDTLDRLLKRGKYEPIPEPEPEPIPEPEPEPPREPTPPPIEPEPQPEETRPTSRSSKKGSAKGKGSLKASGDKSPKRDKSGGKDDKKSARSSSSGKKSPGKKGKKSKTPEPEPEIQEEPVEPPGTPPPAPGTEMYEYVDEPLENTLAECLAPHWESIESTYIDTSKTVFNNVRTEREKIIRYFYTIKKDFLQYLRRPDSKQDFIDQWLKDYNTVSEDMRNDDETMSELHQKVDDLRDRLWNICDERKIQAEEEMNTNMNDGWLDDRLGILSNHYITEMQAEVDRFQDTVQLMKDYYKGMDGPIPDESKSDYSRLALVELPSTDKPGSPTKLPEAVSKPPTPPPEEERTTPKPPRSRSATPKGKKGKRGGSGKRDDEQIVTPPPTDAPAPGRRIPLMPRKKPGTAPDNDQPPPSTAAGKADPKKDKNAKPGAKKSTTNVGDEKSESPIIGTKDPDERILLESYENGVRALTTIIAQEEALRRAAEEAELEAAMAAAAEKEKAAKTDKKGGGKKGKSRSPSPKKGKKDKSSAQPTEPTPPPQEETEEEKAKKKIKQKAREEFFTSIKMEESACKTRLELIKSVAIKNLNNLKNNADQVYAVMNSWLGARFLKEIESIDHMSEKIRHCIESNEKITEQIILVQEDFLIADDVKTIRTPSPPPRPTPVEEPHPDYFTVNQLMSLYSQFSLVAKDGIISVKSFIDIFQEFTSLTHGMEILPDNWMNIQLNQLQDLASMLSFDGEYINWKTFLVAICQPIMLPTTDQLMETLNRFKSMDQKNTGSVTIEQYDQMDLWFEIERMKTPINFSEPYQYNRMENLKHFLFEFFADHSTQPSRLYYKNMLLFFSVDSDAYEGFIRALSVVADKLVKPDEASDDTPIYIDSLFEVLHHGENIGQSGDSSRFALPPDQEKSLSMEKLQQVYTELCGDTHSGPSFKILMEHPTLQDCLNKFSRFKQVELRSIFNPMTPGEFAPDTISIRD